MNGHLARSLAPVLVAGFLLPAGLRAAPTQSAGLKIVVIEGEDGVNIIDQKTAVKPVVEVRDRNDLPVAGVAVLFILRSGGGSASLNNGVAQVSLTTDAAGRASVTLNPLGRGAVQLDVQATYQGQTATAAIHQTNFQTAAEAAQAGKTPSQSSGGAAAGAGAAGGLSGAVIGGIVAGGVGGAFAIAKAVGSKDPPNRPPTAGGVTASPSATLLGTDTPIAFTVQGSDLDNDPLTYSWDFGDGGAGSGASPTHIYTAAGTFTAKVTISDGKASVSSQTSVTVKIMTGNWNPFDNFTLTLTQSGSALAGTGLPAAGLVTVGVRPGTVTSASIRTTSPRVMLTYTYQQVTAICIYTFTFTFAGDPSEDVNSIRGTAGTNRSPNNPALCTAATTLPASGILVRQ